jgi:flavin-dependent dehydrogenase
MVCDVAIIGGGPAGSTLATLLRKYDPSLSVHIFERESFPRDHVGESQLPAICPILDEMGVWDAVEAANFPIKIGGTYRWGKTDELWDFEFLPGEKFRSEPRPGKYVGQRRMTAFQVDRSIYDKILLDHAREMGSDVHECATVSMVKVDGSRIQSLTVDEEEVSARYYVDCSGEAGVLRRALGVSIQAPTALRNIAIWDYWQDAEWATTIGNGGTRIQVMSLGWGWLWFIPITETRTSIGLVMPASYLKASGKSKEQLYAEALKSEPLISHLIRNARCEGQLKGTKDWNFLADNLAGENWFLAGDSCGFADPILSAGMTLAHTGARKLAYTILELDRGEHDAAWLKEQYSENHRSQIRHHMQFADYWYSANGRFTDLKEYCSEIAEEAGLSLDPEGAFRWLATGGFALENPGTGRAFGFGVGAIKFITQLFSDESSAWKIAKYNVWRPALADAQRSKFGHYFEGRVHPVDCYKKGRSLLPFIDLHKLILSCMEREPDATRLVNVCAKIMMEQRGFAPEVAAGMIYEAVEGLIEEGWVECWVDPHRPFIKVVTPHDSPAMHPNRDNLQVAR